MKCIIICAAVLFLLSSCNNANTANKKAGSVDTAVVEKQSFFPVTAYIKGQLYSITTKGINPLKYTTIHDHTDSVWLKTEELNSAVKDFLTPEIDSTNLTSLFSENKFVDRSLDDAFTFTYDPIKKLPDSMQLIHWDVYVDSKTGNVQRIYMLKNTKDNKQLQLTWLNDRYCKIITIDNGTSKVEKEEKISWDF